MGRHDREERLRLMEADPEAAAMAVLRGFVREEPDSEFADEALDLLERWHAARRARKEAARAAHGGRDHGETGG